MQITVNNNLSQSCISCRLAILFVQVYLINWYSTFRKLFFMYFFQIQPYALRNLDVSFKEIILSSFKRV